MKTFGFGVNFKDIEEKQTVSQFDSAAGDAAQQIGDDTLEIKAAESEIQGLRKLALVAVLQLSDDVLESNLEDELPSDRLDALITQGDDESDDDIDEHTAQIISANVADALASLGVSEDTINDVFSDDTVTADAAIESAAEIVAQNVPTGDELAAFVEAFVFGESVAGFDSAVGKTIAKVNAMGQKMVYKAFKAIRNGVVTVVNKRLNPDKKVRLTAAQKIAVKKMQRKAQTGAAIKKRLRSLKKSNRMGL